MSTCLSFLLCLTPVSSALAGIQESTAPQPLAAAPSSAGLAAELDELVLSLLQEKAAVGLSVAAAVEDEIVVAKGYGLADLEFGVLVDAETMFRIGSVTKQFTAAAIMKLYREGKLDIDAEVGEYLPDYPTHGESITVRHLLAHTSGIPSYTELGLEFWGDVSVEITDEQMVDLWRDKGLVFQPGERFAYNNSGYYLLGMIIDRVAERPFAEYWQEEVLRAAGAHANAVWLEQRHHREPRPGLSLDRGRAGERRSDRDGTSRCRRWPFGECTRLGEVAAGPGCRRGDSQVRLPGDDLSVPAQ